MKSKTKGLKFFNGCFETYTRNSGLDDEEPKKKVIGIVNGSFETLTLDILDLKIKNRKKS